MNIIEEWWKQLELPKYKLGDVGYIADEGEVKEVTVVEITASFDPMETEYSYELEAEDGETFFKSAEDIYTDRAVPERICRIAALEEREQTIHGWIVQAEAEIKRLKDLASTGIEERIKGCEEDKVNWTKDLEDVQKQIKDLEE